MPHAAPLFAEIAQALDAPADPRGPDPTREGFWRLHNCSKCRDGKQPCVRGGVHRCEWPYARND